MTGASRSHRAVGDKTAWPTLRAILIAVVLVLHGSLALPWPDLGESDLDYAMAQDELQIWSARLSGLGIDRSPAQLRMNILDVGQSSKSAQRRLRWVAGPVLRLTGTGQAWGLFAYPDPYPGRLVVMTRSSPRGSGPDWSVLYRAPGQGPDWLVERLEYRRVRGIYDDNGDRPHPGILFNRFCDWLAAEIMLRDPKVQGVLVRLDRVVVRTPKQEGERPPDARRVVRRRTRQDVADRLRLLGVPLPRVSPTGGAAELPFSRSPVGP